MPQDGPKMAPRSPKMAPRSPQEPKMNPRCPKIGPRRPQHGAPERRKWCSPPRRRAILLNWPSFVCSLWFLSSPVLSKPNLASKMALGWPEDAPRWRQDGSREGPRLPQDGPKRAQTDPKLVQKGSKQARADPNMTLDCLQVGIKMPQDGPKMASRSPKMAPRSPQEPKMNPRCPRNWHTHMAMALQHVVVALFTKQRRSFLQNASILAAM